MLAPITSAMAIVFQLGPSPARPFCHIKPERACPNPSMAGRPTSGPLKPCPEARA